MQANWFGCTASIDNDNDPFSNPSRTMPITKDSSKEDIRDRLVTLVNYEARLDRQGITCPLRDLPNSSCSACPVSKADDHDNRLSTLCRISREQERIEMMMLARTFELSS